jgi:hypothetical protein
MKSTITHALLSRLTNTIDNGQPIWGLLWANEYKEELGAVYNALLRKARGKIEELEYADTASPKIKELIRMTLLGATLSSFKSSARQELQNIERREWQIKRKVISVAGRRTKRFEIGLPNYYSGARSNFFTGQKAQHP